MSFAATASASNGTRTPWMARPRLPAPRAALRGAPNLRPVRHDASCASATHGGYAFDDNTAFKTNLADAEYFGQANLAAANESGTFEGYGNTVCDDESVIAGGQSNTIDGGNTSNPNVASTSFIGAGYLNTVSSFDAFLGAGRSNTVSNSSAFIGAGEQDLVSGEESGIGAGYNNQVSNSESFIGAGSGNSVSAYQAFVGAGTGNAAAGVNAVVGAGASNTNSASSAFIGSGASNTIAGGGTYGSIIGGNRNSISGQYASVIGGYGNAATGAYAIIAGGDGNIAAGTVSFAAGYHADAVHGGSFVWSDYVSGSSSVKDSASNQFVVRASGGTYVYSNEAATAGVRLAAGSGTWSSLSDRSAKTDVRPLDDASILAKVTMLPVSTWRYKSESGVRHAGPMAQDFYSAFGVGEDDRHITSLDEDGVALAAIKALSRQVGALRKENASLKALSRQIGDVRSERTELDALSREVGVLREQNTALASRVGRATRPPTERKGAPSAS